MTKIMLGLLPLLCVLTFTMGGSRTLPPAASPAKPSVTSPQPEFGSCRWYCGSRSYTSASQCAAQCQTECDEIC